MRSALPRSRASREASQGAADEVDLLSLDDFAALKWIYLDGRSEFESETCRTLASLAGRGLIELLPGDARDGARRWRVPGTVWSALALRFSALKDELARGKVPFNATPPWRRKDA